MDILLNKDSESRRKSLMSIANTGFLNVWEGAIRSGKTVYALCAFALYVVRSPEKMFLLSGRTLQTIEKNCITQDYGLLNLIPGSKYGKIKNSLAITFSVNQDGKIINKVIYISGASDIQAYMGLRGNTYGGWFADEINMHDRRFVEEALNRTGLSLDRRHFWTLNPDNPKHWIYTDFIDYYADMSPEKQAGLGGYHWWHYVPSDNPAMTSAMLRALELQYPQGSYLHKRYILGLRCQAEGLVYPNVTDAMFLPDEMMEGVDVRYCAVDFGANHPTVMLFGGYYRGNKRDWRIVAEYYDEKSGKTLYELYAGYLDVCSRLKVDPTKVLIAVDPSALILRNEFIKHKLQVIKAKNDVNPGIEYTRDLLYNGNLFLSQSCEHTRTEFGIYSWDEKASERGEDKVVKADDDCMDALRYFCFTHIRPLIG